LATYLITGGAGFIGSHLAEALVAQGHAVRILDNFRTGRRSNLAAIRNKVEILRGDVRDRSAVRAAVRGADFVLHLAALVSVAESIAHPEQTLDVNLNGTLVLLEAARKAKTRGVVMASSCAVYGAGPVPAREEQAPLPMSPYAVSKLAAESLAVSYHLSCGLPVTCLRYFNVFGPRQDSGSPYSGVIAVFASRAVDGGPATIYGDGRQTRDFIYVADVVQANLLACASNRAVGQVLNVGTGRARSLLDLRSELSTLRGSPLAVRYAEARPGDIYHSRSDPSRARRLLGFRPRTDFRSGLAETLRWMKDGAAGGAA
jgi:UDP-glucose 4-epimerase